MSKVSQPATKADIAKLDQKIDGFKKESNRQFNLLAKTILETQAEVRQIKDRLDGMATKSDIHRILGAIDAFTQKAEIMTEPRSFTAMR